MVPYCEVTLKILRASRVHPQISAYDALHGTFDYNKTPIAPPGCKIVAHQKPYKRKSWDPASLYGWYV